MPPAAKYAVIRQAIAQSLFGPKPRNKLLTAAQYAGAFNTCINLGGGIKLTEEIVKKSFDARDEDLKYSLCCKNMEIDHDGDCVLSVLKSMQLTFGGKRCTAFGIFDSAKTAKEMASEENVLDDDNVGRLRLALTDPMKNKLVDCLLKEFPNQCRPTIQQFQSPEPEQRRVSIEEHDEEMRDDNDAQVEFGSNDLNTHTS
ncbi:hypothetical protein ACHAWO_006959 [Cyclotella atomus]|uniref:Uncharacterized protein n=1 Tax=Cyclotella atomus TaxID=382360 RepID=A0ABD3NAU5_9STRA